MVKNEHFLQRENLMDDDMIRDFPPYFKSYVKNHQLLCQHRDFNWGWVFWSGEDNPHERPPPPPPFSDFRFPLSFLLAYLILTLPCIFIFIFNGTLIAPPMPEFMEKIKSYIKDLIVFWPRTQFLAQFWKVIEIEGKRLLTTRHQPFGFDFIHEGLCRYRLMSLDFEFDLDGVSDEHLGLLGRVFCHQQLESTPNVQYYSCNEYPQRYHAISCDINQSVAFPLFESSTRCCIGVIEVALTDERTYRSWGSFNSNRVLKAGGCWESSFVPKFGLLQRCYSI
ncbi:hypothetical protein CsSME_00049534 [Camellia sinensis var. sinensis]